VLAAPVTLYDAAGNPVIVVSGTKVANVGASGGTLAFYGGTPTALQTGVAVTAAGIHAALVSLNLITA
jgi:hypothetical protein